MAIEGLGNTYAIPVIDKDRDSVTDRKKRDRKKDRKKQERDSDEDSKKKGKIDIRI